MRAEYDLLSGPHEDMRLEHARERKEIVFLHQERDLLKKATLSSFGRQGDEVCMACIATQKADMSLARLCACASVSISGDYNKNSVRL